MTNRMNNLLKLEELGQFLFNQLDYSWWIFPSCMLLPDLSMRGYLANLKTGAWLYNFFPHKLVAIIILGFWLNNSLLTLTGVILFGYSSMGRVFGYGLKFNNNFKNTPLGWIEKKG